MITFHSLYVFFLSLQRLKQSNFKPYSLVLLMDPNCGPWLFIEYNSLHIPSIFNKQLQTIDDGKTLASSACLISFFKRRNITIKSPQINYMIPYSINIKSCTSHVSTNIKSCTSHVQMQSKGMYFFASCTNPIMINYILFCCSKMDA